MYTELYAKHYQQVTSEIQIRADQLEEEGFEWEARILRACANFSILTHDLIDVAGVEHIIIRVLPSEDEVYRAPIKPELAVEYALTEKTFSEPNIPPNPPDNDHAWDTQTGKWVPITYDMIQLRNT